jgi:hypothetical protein
MSIGLLRPTYHGDYSMCMIHCPDFEYVHDQMQVSERDIFIGSFATSVTYS